MRGGASGWGIEVETSSHQSFGQTPKIRSVIDPHQRRFVLAHTKTTPGQLYSPHYGDIKIKKKEKKRKAQGNCR